MVFDLHLFYCHNLEQSNFLGQGGIIIGRKTTPNHESSTNTPQAMQPFKIPSKIMVVAPLRVT